MKKVLLFCLFSLISFETHSKEKKSKRYITNIGSANFCNLINKNSPSSFTNLRLGMRKLAINTIIYNKKGKIVRAKDLAYIYTAIYLDNLKVKIRVSSVFGKTKADAEAKRYAVMFGQLPNFVRKNIKTITIHEKNGRGWFISGGKSIFVFNNLFQKNCFEEVMFHEAAHSLDNKIDRTKWKNAQKYDRFNFITAYALSQPDREDIAETVMYWYAVRHRPSTLSAETRNDILKRLRGRLKLLDQQRYNMFP